MEGEAYSQQHRQQSANSGGTKEENPQLVCGHSQSKLLVSWKSLGGGHSRNPYRNVLFTLGQKTVPKHRAGVVKRAWWKRQP